MRRDLKNWTALGSATFLAMWSGQAVAQPAFNWSGFYIGGSLGVAAHGDSTLSYPNGGLPGPGSVGFVGDVPVFGDDSNSQNFSSWPTGIGGQSFAASLNAGYNFQSGRFVFGVETDFTFVNGGFVWGESASVSGDTRVSTIQVSGVDMLFSVRPRVGIAMDRLLLFGTGGLAFGHADAGVSAQLDFDNGKGLANWNGHSTAWRPGFILGGGAEYAVSNAVSLKAEALYFDIGSADVTATGTGSWNGGALTVPSFTSQVNLRGTLVKVGANVRF